MLIDKLSAAGYIEVEKTFKGKKPCTICRITPAGLKAFEDYVEALKSYLSLPRGWKAKASFSFQHKEKQGKAIGFSGFSLFISIVKKDDSAGKS